MLGKSGDHVRQKQWPTSATQALARVGEALFFRTKAGVLASALLHAAALEDKPMSWLMRAVSGNSESGTRRGG